MKTDIKNVLTSMAIAGKAAKAFDGNGYDTVVQAAALLLIDLDTRTTGGTGSFIRFVCGYAEWGQNGLDPNGTPNDLKTAFIEDVKTSENGLN